MLNFDEIDEPLELESFQGNLFDGERFNGLDNYILNLDKEEILDIFNFGIRKTGDRYCHKNFLTTSSTT